IENKSVLDNIKYAFYLRNSKEQVYDFDNLLKLFEIEDVKNVKVKKLNKLQRLKVSFARLYLRKFTFLILDEIFECVSDEDENILFNKIKLLNFKSLIITAKNIKNYGNLNYQIIKMKAGFIDNERE
ncbi:MAG: hypothetical protein ACI4TX_02645, partial [Christensenellales bacterium]